MLLAQHCSIKDPEADQKRKIVRLWARNLWSFRSSDIPEMKAAFGKCMRPNFDRKDLANATRTLHDDELKNILDSLQGKDVYRVESV